MFQQDKVQHILVRHEQGATHMAEGYAHATGRVGVCLGTSGPGATNLVTGIADAYMDSVPLVVLSVPFGCIVGYWMAQLMIAMFSSDLFRLPYAATDATYGFAVSVVLAASMATARC